MRLGPPARWRRSPSPVRRRPSRRDQWRRTKALRLVCAGLAAAAVWLVGSRFLPHDEDPGVPVVVAAHDLALGAAVAAEDVTIERRAPGDVPAGTLREPEAAVGHIVSGPVARGEPLSDKRFRGPSQLAGLGEGVVAVAVPVSGTAVLSALRPADVVAVLVAGSGQTVAQRARVLAAPGVGIGGPAGLDALAGSGTSGAGAGAEVLLALTTDEARAVAASMGGGGGATSFVLALRG